MSIRLYIGGLSPRAADDDVRALFKEAGIQPEAVAVARDPKRNRSRCFAFVDLSTEDEAEAATAVLNGKENAERTLKVRPAHRRPEVHGGFGKEEGFRGIYGKDSEMKRPKRRR